MGFRHTPKSQRRECGVYCAGERPAAVAENMTFRREEHSGRVDAMTGASLRNQTENLGVRTALFALRCYKAYLSVLFAGTCRFEPTCSQYAYQAIERFGVLRGIWLGTRRLSRCHPFSRKFGYDPVPDQFSASLSADAYRETKENHAAANQAIDRSAVVKDGIRL